MSVRAGREFSFDKSDQYFTFGQNTIHSMIELLSETAKLYRDVIDKLNNIKNESPVGFDINIDYSIPIAIVSSDIEQYKTILANASNVRDLVLYYNENEDWDKKGVPFGNNILFNAAKGLYSLDDVISGYNKTINYSEIEKDGYTVQGLTYVDTPNGTKVLITAHHGEDGPSRLYIYDYKKGISEKLIIFNNKDHVGGVTYDKDHDVLWVASDNGKVNTYNFTKMDNISVHYHKLNCRKIYTIDFNDPNSAKVRKNMEIPNDINVKKIINYKGHKQSGMDSLYYNDGKLYSNTYGYKGQLVETNIKYKTDNKGKIIGIISNNSGKVLGNLDGATQGLAFYEENGKTYAVTASSAAGSKSRLTKWLITDSSAKKVGNHYFDQSGLEGIEIHDNQVKGIFEYDTQTSKVLANTDEINKKANPVTDEVLSLEAWVWDSIHD